MDRDNNLTEHVLVRELVAMQGWKNIILPYIEGKIKASTSKLLTAQPNDVAQIAKYQTTAKTYSEFITYIDNLVK